MAHVTEHITSTSATKIGLNSYAFWEIVLLEPYTPVVTQDLIVG